MSCLAVRPGRDGQPGGGVVGQGILPHRSIFNETTIMSITLAPTKPRLTDTVGPVAMRAKY